MLLLFDRRSILKFLFKFLIFIFFCLLSINASFCNPTKISDLKFDNSDKIFFINSIGANNVPEVTRGILTNPDRVYFDIKDSQLITPSVTYALSNSVIEEVTISQFTLAPDVVRVTIKYDKKKARKGFEGFEIEKIKSGFVVKYNKEIVENSKFSLLYTDNVDCLFVNVKDKVKTKEVAPNVVQTNSSSQGLKNLEVPTQKQPLKTIQTSPIQVIQTTQSSQTAKTSPISLIEAFDKNANKNFVQEEKNLNSSFYINSVNKTSDGILLKGFGTLTLTPGFYLDNPKRAIIDIKNAVLKTELRNKTYAIGDLLTQSGDNTLLSQREILRIAQFDKNTVRLVIQGENCKNYRLALSPDGQSIYIAKRQDVVNAKLTQYNAKLLSYRATKENGMNILTLKFDSPVSLSIFEENSFAYFDIQNSNDFNQLAFNEVIKEEYFKDLQIVKIALDKFRIQKPIEKNIFPEVKINEKRDEIKIYFKKTTQAQREEAKKQEIKNIIQKTQGKLEISSYYVVVLDAGHGGEDHGAIRGNVNEKDLNLAVTKLVEKELKENKINVKMTRSRDVFLELEERVEFSNKVEPNIFVSIHHNASLKEDIKGIETHWWRDESLSLAKTIHSKITTEKLLKKRDTIDRGLCKSQFYVINHTVAPAVLIEVGFISNKDELDTLKSKKHQEDIAKAIADGIIEYLKSRGKK